MTRKAASTVVIDLDGTLISYEKIYSIYKKAYETTINILKKLGKEIPKELERHSEQYYRAFLEIDGFREVFEKVYLKILEENSFLNEERERAEKIYRYVKEKFNPREIYIITGNSQAKEILKRILPEIEESKVYITNMGKYKEEKEGLLKVLQADIYVADLPLDEEIAKSAGTNFLNVKEIEKELFSN